ncbi:caspase family protein [Longispora albida]|uniref:caspase family protein n=1 Tax=Longispora albida TaxID=203523 RepID=UPI000371478C|nr:caspase family protein [Longispora albida]
MADRVHKALLVANWEFPEDEAGVLTELKGARHDGELLRAVLSDPGTGLHAAGDIRLVANVGKQAVLTALEQFFARSTKNEQLLLYYSGHGFTDLFGRLYLCARDTNTTSLRATGISARDISELMDDSPAVAKIVLLDCCYSGGFKGGPDTPGELGGKGRFVLTSSLSGQRTPDAKDGGAPSPFTGYLAEALRGECRASGGYVSADDLYEHVNMRMAAAGLSTPQRILKGTIADLVLARVPSVPSEPPPPPPPLPPSPKAVIREEDVLAGYLRAHDAEGRGETEAAIAGYRQVAAARRGDWSTLAALRAARMAKDTSLFEQVIAAEHPEWSPLAAYELGKMLQATDPAGADAASVRAAEFGHPLYSPGAAQHAILGRVQRKRPVEEIRQLLQHAAGIRKSEAAAHATLGVMLMDSGQLDEARVALRRAAGSGDEQVAPYAAQRLAELYRMKGCLTAADELGRDL